MNANVTVRILKCNGYILFSELLSEKNSNSISSCFTERNILEALREEATLAPFKEHIDALEGLGNIKESRFELILRSYGPNNVQLMDNLKRLYREPRQSSDKELSEKDSKRFQNIGLGRVNDSHYISLLGNLDGAWEREKERRKMAAQEEREGLSLNNASCFTPLRSMGASRQSLNLESQSVRTAVKKSEIEDKLKNMTGFNDWSYIQSSCQALAKVAASDVSRIEGILNKKGLKTLKSEVLSAIEGDDWLIIVNNPDKLISGCQAQVRAEF